jgi:prepilin-type N-terminal cleavage/methylation domain-containing protein
MRTPPLTIKSVDEGFTLVEVVISIVILSFITITAYSALGGISESKIYLDDEREIVTAAGAVLGRLTREIQLTTASVPYPVAPPYNRSLSNAPTFIGESIQGEKERSMDRVTFYATEVGQYFPDATLRNSGLVQISYRAEKSPPEDHSEMYYLVRDELPIPPHDPKAPFESIMTFPLAKNVESLDFSFMTYGPTGARWSEGWGGNSQQTRQPSAVKISLTLRSRSGKLFTFATVVKPLE